MSVIDIETGYEFETKPYKHQAVTWRETRDLEVWALLLEMGLGKSKIAIDTIAWLYEQKKIRGAVVIAPKGVYRNWIAEEIPIHMPKRIPLHIGIWDAAGTAEQRRSLVPFEAWTGRRPELMILCMNVESFSSKKAPIFAWRFMKECPSLIVVDESTTLKHHTSKRTEHLLKLAPYAKYRRIMSGEPAANSPLNLFSQFEFLGPGLLGHKSFHGFRQEYAHLVKRNFQHKSCGKCTPCKKGNTDACLRYSTDTIDKTQGDGGYRNVNDLTARVKRYATIIKKEDCLDLPPKIYQTRDVTMGEDQAAAYHAMERESVVFIEHVLKYGTTPKHGIPRCATPLDIDSESRRDDSKPRRPRSQGRVGNVVEIRSALIDYEADGSAQATMDFEADAEPEEETPRETDHRIPQVMTAQVIITQIMRLHQIACGFMTRDKSEGDAGAPHERTHGFKSNPRLEELIHLLSETQDKAVIWSVYRHNIREIERRLIEEYGPGCVGTYYGPTKSDERVRIVKEFQNRDSQMRFFLGSQAAAGRGLTLTAASTEVFYSNNYDAEVRNQAEDRLHRISQTKTVNIIDLICQGTVDVDIISALRKKTSLSNMVTPSNWRDLLLGKHEFLKVA